ncbi:hypothetical protein [Halomonas getboli]|uniref:hypothetical protein n=1 Tax=Halomonas getboli TaxID=2935862 RepID=UPI001FFF4683|nr:hypothetical protein [Halomonas getboli]MCK2183534.1 hypothetical protein [Halomonas getboli]
MAALMQPTGNEVSREGLDDVRRSGRSARQQVRIMAALYWCAKGEGWTRQELAELPGIPLSSVCPRCHELLALQLIDVIGTVGKPARQVLGITDKGVDWLLALASDEGGKGDA